MLVYLLYILCMTTTWLLVLLLTVRRLFEPMLLYLAVGALLLILPAFFYLFDIEGLRSDLYMEDRDNIILLQGLIIALFSLAMIVAYKIFSKQVFARYIFPHSGSSRLDGLAMIGVFVFFMGSVAIAGFALSAAGNIFGAIRAVRYEDLLAGYNFLTQFVRIGGFLAAALFLDVLRRKRFGKRAPTFLSLFTSFMLAVILLAGFIMGGKSFVIYPLVVIALGYALYFSKRPVTALTLFAVSIFCVIAALQFVRETMVHENRLSENFITTSSLGVSLLDSNLIYLEYMPPRTEMGEDFYNGLIGVVPRIFWPDKPAQINAGGRFRKMLTGDYQGGAWPVFGFNLWYVNFGWPGVLMGGFITGWMIRVLRERYQDYAANPYSLSFMTFFTIAFIIPGGVDANFLINYILNVVPVFAFVILADRRLYPVSILRYKNKEVKRA